MLWLHHLADASLFPQPPSHVLSEPLTYPDTFWNSQITCFIVTAKPYLFLGATNIYSHFTENLPLIHFQFLDGVHILDERLHCLGVGLKHFQKCYHTNGFDVSCYHTPRPQQYFFLAGIELPQFCVLKFVRNAWIHHLFQNGNKSYDDCC